MRLSSSLTWTIAIGMALGAHAGVFWVHSMLQSQGDQPKAAVLAVEIHHSPVAVDTNSPQQANAETPRREIESVRKPETVKNERKPIRLEPEKALKQSVVASVATPSPAKVQPSQPEPSLADLPPPSQPRQKTAEANLGTNFSSLSDATPQSGLEGPTVSMPGVNASPQQSGAYWDEIRVALERAKQYPLMSKRRRETDSLVLVLELNRRGEVLGHELVEPSHFPRLNAATATMIARATPLPPVPDDMPGERIRLRYRIDFGLQ